MKHPLPLQLELDPGAPDRQARPGRAPRWLLRLRVRGSLPDADEVFLVHNLSETGLLIEASADLAIGSVLALDLPLVGPTEATVEWASENLFGCSFLQPIPTEAITAALLRNPLKDSAGSNRSPIAPETIPDAEIASFCIRLKNLRLRRGLSLEDIASRVKVSRQTVWYWETGKRVPSPQNLVSLADALDVAVIDLDVDQSSPRRGRDTFSKVKERIARELGVAPESVEINIRF